MKNKCAAMFIVSLFMMLFYAPRASAWGPGEVEMSAETIPSAPSREKNLKDIALMGSDEQVRTVKAEVQEGKSIRIAHVNNEYSRPWAIAFGDEQTFHYLEANSSAIVTTVGNEDKVTISLSSYYPTSGRFLYVADDIKNYLSPEVGPHARIIKYKVNYAAIGQWLSTRDSTGQQRGVNIYNEIYSKNKRFGVFWINRDHFARVDFLNDEIKVFTKRHGEWYDGIYSARASAITNDGRWVFMNDGSSVIDMASTCGLVINPRYFNATIDSNYVSCPERYIDPTPVAGYNAYHQNFELSDDEQTGTFIMTDYPYNYTHPIMRVTLKVKKPLKEFGTYLSLGDSYTSGQGDIGKTPEGGSYYLAGTSAWDGCRISSRAYPYLLQREWRVENADMHNVSCSGARLVLDYYARNESYYGQNRQLVGLDKNAIIKKKDAALEKDTAGVVPQLEFVKKYHPDVLTFTGGGNDVGFADILKYCASSIETCRYVESKSKTMHDDLMAQIDDQYEYTKRFISEIQKISPSTKVYVIGYPRFINDEAICGLNAALMNRAEARLVNESVDRLNARLAKAAKDTGVVYLDVSNALDGGRICEGSEYITDFVAGYLDSQRIDSPNMFHPNAAGHQKIAEAVKKSKENYEKGIVPTLPTFAKPVQTNILKKQTLTDGDIRKGRKTTLTSEKSTFKSGAKIRLTVYSEETFLGEAVADSEGSARWTGSIPETIASGFHQLTMTGEAADGRQVQVQQFVTIAPKDAKVTNNVCTVLPFLFDGEKDVCESQRYEPKEVSKHLGGQTAVLPESVASRVDIESETSSRVVQTKTTNDESARVKSSKIDGKSNSPEGAIVKKGNSPLAVGLFAGGGGIIIGAILSWWLVLRRKSGI